jgi:rubrerythrin
MSTQDNLEAAFSGESQANRRYLAFAIQAERDGYPQVARLFRAAAGSGNRPCDRASPCHGRYRGHSEKTSKPPQQEKATNSKRCIRSFSLRLGMKV